MMDNKAFSVRIRDLRKTQRNINDIHICCSVVIEALQQVKGDDEFLNHKTFTVPSLPIIVSRLCLPKSEVGQVPVGG